MGIEWVAISVPDEEVYDMKCEQSLILLVAGYIINFMVSEICQLHTETQLQTTVIILDICDT